MHSDENAGSDHMKDVGTTSAHVRCTFDTAKLLFAVTFHDTDILAVSVLVSWNAAFILLCITADFNGLWLDIGSI